VMPGRQSSRSTRQQEPTASDSASREQSQTVNFPDQPVPPGEPHPYPIVAQHELDDPVRRGPLRLGRRRDNSEIPKIKPHEVLVWRVGSRYIVDGLPVLAKLMSGSSTYDQLLAEQRMSDERVYETDLKFREETATVDKEVEIYLSEMRKRDRMRNLDRQERVRNAQGETDGLEDVRALAAQWLRDAEAGLGPGA
jgi:hypothetical protein